MTRTESPRGRFFYIDGRRVSADAFRTMEILARRSDTFTTDTRAGVTRHHKYVTV